MPKTAPQRAENGQFLPGCSPGPGRPRNRWKTETTFKRQLAQKVSDETWDEICNALIESAKDGNLQAIGIVFKFLVDRAPSLRELAAMECAGVSEDRQIEQLADTFAMADVRAEYCRRLARQSLTRLYQEPK